MDDRSRTITNKAPTGTGAAIFGTTLALAILSTGFFSIRMRIKIHAKKFDLSDSLFLIGWVGTIIHNAALIRGLYLGLGGSQTDPPADYMETEARMFNTLANWSYIPSNTFIKCGLMTTLLAISTRKRYTYIIWAMLVSTIILAFLVYFPLLAQCWPTAKTWRGDYIKGGRCGIEPATTIAEELRIVFPIYSVITDFILSIMPAFMLWSLQMHWKMKASLIFVLSIGGVASIGNVNRMVYYINIDELATPKWAYILGHINCWQGVENNLALIAASLPLFAGLVRKHMSSSDTPMGSRPALVTFGRGETTRRRAHTAELTVTNGPVDGSYENIEMSRGTSSAGAGTDLERVASTDKVF